MKRRRGRERTGEELKLDGVQRALFNADEEWRHAGYAAIEFLARSGLPFTSEDVIDRVGMPGGHPSCLGALFVAASKKNLIRWTGTLRKNRRPSRHAAVMRVWTGTGAR